MASNQDPPSSPTIDRPRGVSLSPKKLQFMEKPFPHLPKTNPELGGYKRGFMTEVFKSKNLHLCQTLAEQVYELHLGCLPHPDSPQEWSFSLVDFGKFWWKSRQQIRRFLDSWEKVLKSGGENLPGRPKALSDQQKEEIVEYVRKCDDELVLLTQSNLLEWVQGKFGVSLSVAWPSNFIHDQKGIFLVDAEPLEKARAEVSEEQLKTNAKELAEKLALTNPELVLNMDKTALDSNRATKKEKVVSTHMCPRPYVTDRGESHITFVPTVAITGWSLPILVIVKTLTVVSDIAVRYGFPKCHWAHLVTSSSAYINKELFLYWVDEILVPGVCVRRRMLALPENSKALLVLDGCLAHCEEKLKEITKSHAIDYHFLVPHSSHLTQPLDRGFFMYFKQKFKTTRNYDTKNKVGVRLMRGLTAMTATMTPYHVRCSFWRAGFELDYQDGKPEVTLNVTAWLTQHNSPQTDEKEEFFMTKEKMKSSRTKTVTKGLTESEKKKKEEVEKKRKERGEKKKEEAETPTAKKRKEKESEKIILRIKLPQDQQEK